MGRANWIGDVAATSHYFFPYIGVHLGQHFIYLPSLSVFFNHGFTWSWTKSFWSFLHCPYEVQQKQKYEITKQIKRANDFCNKGIERRARNFSNGARQDESFDWKMLQGYEVSTDELFLVLHPFFAWAVVSFTSHCLLLSVNVARWILAGNGYSVDIFKAEFVAVHLRNFLWNQIIVFSYNFQRHYPFIYSLRELHFMIAV